MEDRSLVFIRFNVKKLLSAVEDEIGIATAMPYIHGRDLDMHRSSYNFCLL
jgi:hypothetical protein